MVLKWTSQLLVTCHITVMSQILGNCFLFSLIYTAKCAKFYPQITNNCLLVCGMPLAPFFIKNQTIAGGQELLLKYHSIALRIHKCQGQANQMFTTYSISIIYRQYNYAISVQFFCHGGRMHCWFQSCICKEVIDKKKKERGRCLKTLNCQKNSFFPLSNLHAWTIYKGHPTESRWLKGSGTISCSYNATCTDVQFCIPGIA